MEIDLLDMLEITLYGDIYLRQGIQCTEDFK